MAIVDVRKVIQELVVPELQEIKSGIKIINSEIKRLDEKIDSFREEFRSEIKRLDERINGLEREVRVTREEFKLAIEIHERLAAVEARVGR